MSMKFKTCRFNDLNLSREEIVWLHRSFDEWAERRMDDVRLRRNIETYDQVRRIMSEQEPKIKRDCGR